MDRDEIIALLEARGLLTGKKADTLSDDQLVDMLREAMATDKQVPSGSDPAAHVTSEEMREAVALVEARQTMRDRVSKSALPDKAKTRLVERFEGAERFTEAEVDQAIRDEAEYLASFTESGHVQGLGDSGRVVVGDGPFKKPARCLMPSLTAKTRITATLSLSRKPMWPLPAIPASQAWFATVISQSCGVLGIHKL